MLKDYFSDRYFLLIAVLAFVYLTYWLTYANSLYSTFNLGYYDYGITLYSAYWHLHSVPLVNPLQYFVFYAHISPISFLLIQIYRIFQYPITYIVINELF